MPAVHSQTGERNERFSPEVRLDRLREFALAVPPIGGLAAAEILLRLYEGYYSASIVSALALKWWSQSGGGGGYPEVAGSENEEALAKVQSHPSETTTVSHLAKAASPR